jgi:ABC-2 type transport system ATP-binding protein
VVGDDLPDVKPLATRILQRGDRCLIILPGQEHLEKVLAVLRQAGGRLISVIPHKDSLEEIFLEQTSRKV